ncbi:MAG: DUF2071 domain-containing protein [Pedosphaera sp.]|nr:DUF2071 domain-containing protein [Pedosphaera sp.]
MVNYAVDPAVLLPLIPRGTEPDTWEGCTYVSLVGFLFLRTTLMGVPVPFHRNFEELNLRFYVRRRGPDGVRRGVVFVKEIVPRRAIALTARWFYNENYATLPMRHRVEISDAGIPFGEGRVEYAFGYPGNEGCLEARVSGPAAPIVSASEAEFITEHYWGYVSRRDGATTEYAVEHPRWDIYPVVPNSASFSADIAAVYGANWGEPLTRPPASAFVAEGSPILVRRGVRVTV